jgi:hypothetical protein
VCNNFLILRLGGDKAGEALKHPFVRPFDITGTPMKGWGMVEERGFTVDKKLKGWLEKAKAFAKTLGSK